MIERTWKVTRAVNPTSPMSRIVTAAGVEA